MTEEQIAWLRDNLTISIKRTANNRLRVELRLNGDVFDYDSIHLGDLTPRDREICAED